MARPKKYNIDLEELEKLASYGCNVNECAEFFGCPAQVISQSYQEIYAKGFNSLKKRLRMAQIKLALGGNATMQIWLGKQYLDQHDKVDTDITSGGKSLVQVIRDDIR